VYTSAGGITVIWTTTPSGVNGSFTAPLTGGGTLLNGATFTATSSSGVTVPYQ
jgi:hypothetical protein